MVHQEMALILDVQTDEWWQDVTTPMLENVRKGLRALVKLIDRQKRKPLYTDFEDRLDDGALVDLPGFTAPDSFERFRAKARALLREHEHHIAVHKLRMNSQPTATDLDELERMLAESGVGASADIEQAKTESQGLGLFVRSLVGLDREAAKSAFASFNEGRHLTANQIESVNLIVDHLTQQGVVPVERLYESPFTALTRPRTRRPLHLRPGRRTRRRPGWRTGIRSGSVIARVTLQRSLHKRPYRRTTPDSADAPRQLRRVQAGSALASADSTS